MTDKQTIADKDLQYITNRKKIAAILQRHKIRIAAIRAEKTPDERKD